MTSERNSPPPLLEWGVASLALPGEVVCGDMHLVEPFPNGALVAAIDGVGHGAEAAAAAQVAVATLRAHAQESLLPLLQRCHETLRMTRGVVLTLASFNALDETLTWVGVGSVEGILLRADGKAVPAHEEVVVYGGVIGLQLPPVRCAVLPVAPGDTLVLATDGIRTAFAAGLPLEDPPQRIADGILARDVKGTDDALVLVARYLGVHRDHYFARAD
jgi:phosphoserine phosphatase RsbX